MNTKNKSIDFLIISTIFLLFLSPVGLVQGSSNGLLTISANENINVETDLIGITITGGGNVPFYTFWDLENNTSKQIFIISPQIFQN